VKILQLIDSLDSGGSERMAINYANMLSESHTSFICTTRAEGLLKHSLNNKVRYLYLNKKHSYDLKAVRELYDYIKNNDIEVIHAHSTSFFLATIIKILNRKIKLIWHDHYGKSEFLKDRKFKVLKLCSSRFDFVISVNETLKNWAENSLNCKNVTFLNNFVTRAKDEPKQTELKGDAGKRIVCLANLRSQKNHLLLLDAFKAVQDFNNDWTLHLVGKDQKDDYACQVRERIGALNLGNKVFIYGNKSDIYNILSQCDIGVLSSSSEGLPLALLEYGLAKLPVVATNVGDCKKVVFSKNEGLLVEVGQTEQFTKALLNYMKDEKIRKLAGENLFDRVSKSFSAKSAINQLIEIYKA
jgi:glycosyltransferase involved in cell wall biosynthesis